VTELDSLNPISTISLIMLTNINMHMKVDNQAELRLYVYLVTMKKVIGDNELDY